MKAVTLRIKPIPLNAIRMFLLDAPVSLGMLKEYPPRTNPTHPRITGAITAVFIRAGIIAMIPTMSAT